MEKPSITRREFLTGLAATPLVAISVTSAYARLIEPYNYRIAEVDVIIRNLPDAFDGFRIAHLTDVHHSRILGIDQIERTVELANQTKPDLIALTGDYTTSYRRYIEPCTEVLGRLRAPEGVWAVLGNHDHYTDPELTAWSLERNKINVLTNRNTLISRGTEAIQLSGIDDWSWGGTEWTRAFYGLNLKRPTILLSHQPGVLDFPQTELMALILSGHTHGGQINLPWFGPPARFLTKDLKYAHGLYQRGETQLYVSSGTGVIGLPVRFGVRPEIAVLTLRRKTEEDGSSEDRSQRSEIRSQRS